MHVVEFQFFFQTLADMHLRQFVVSLTAYIYAHFRSIFILDRLIYVACLLFTFA